MNLYPIRSSISLEERNIAMNQNPMVIWFTGLSGAGKSSIAASLERELFERGYKTFHLDGDNVRNGLNKNLSFTEEDRKENIRRVGEVTALMLDAGLIILSAFISPFESDRQMVREIVGKDRFYEVFVNCPIEICEERDVKGLYKKARSGELKNFTGIDSPYEKPISPNLVINSDVVALDEAVMKVMQEIELRIKFLGHYE